MKQGYIYMCVCVWCVSRMPFLSYRCLRKYGCFGEKVQVPKPFLCWVFSRQTRNSALDAAVWVQFLGWAAGRLDSLFCDHASDATRIFPQLPSCSHAFLCYKPLAQTVSSLSKQTCSMRYCLGCVPHSRKILCRLTKKRTEKWTILLWEHGQMFSCSYDCHRERFARIAGLPLAGYPAPRWHSGTRAFLHTIASTMNVVSTPPSTYTCHLLQYHTHAWSRPNMVNFARYMMKLVCIPVWIDVGVAIPFMPSANGLIGENFIFKAKNPRKVCPREDFRLYGNWVLPQLACFDLRVWDQMVHTYTWRDCVFSSHFFLWTSLYHGLSQWEMYYFLPPQSGCYTASIMRTTKFAH